MRWKQEITTPSNRADTSPCVLGDGLLYLLAQYFTGTSLADALEAFSAADGSLVWKLDLQGTFGPFPGPIAAP